MRIALSGSRGFVGKSVRVHLDDGTNELICIPSVRVHSDGIVRVDAKSYTCNQSIDVIAEIIDGADVVVNAAGLAVPGSSSLVELEMANSVMPSLLIEASVKAKAKRFVHVSSASVQGTTRLLSESERTNPFSPYTKSKASGEHEILRRRDRIETVVYRATSVQGVDRNITRLLTRYANLWAIPIVDRGERHLPVSLSASVGRALAFVCRSYKVPEIVLHPWEGMTVHSLLMALGWNGRSVWIPSSVAQSMESVVGLFEHVSPRIAARARNIDLVLNGQDQVETWFDRSGFEHGNSPDDYANLAQVIRSVSNSKIS